jgi:hypothetical protein
LLRHTANLAAWDRDRSHRAAAPLLCNSYAALHVVLLRRVILLRQAGIQV